MFKFIMTFALAWFAASNAYAYSNPLIRFCHINGGLFEVYPLGTDDMALCRWNDVVVDSLTIVSNVDRVVSAAAGVILSDVIAPSCQAVQAGELQIPTGETICAFSDASKLSLAAVKAGLSNPDRLHLKSVLLTR